MSFPGLNARQHLSAARACVPLSFSLSATARAGLKEEEQAASKWVVVVELDEEDKEVAGGYVG